MPALYRSQLCEASFVVQCPAHEERETTSVSDSKTYENRHADSDSGLLSEGRAR